MNYVNCELCPRKCHVNRKKEIELINIEDVFVQKELSQNTLICLHELEEPYTEVFMLSVFGGFSLKDISLVFGKSESWARVTFYRAKQKLSERMR